MRELTPSEREQLRALERLLRTEVPPERFSCDGRYQEGRMCIEPGDGVWYVFFREMGLGEDVTIHPDFVEAALQLIRNVAPSAEAEERLRRGFSCEA